MQIVLATCARWPELSASDQLYAGALARRGATVRAAAWNGPAAPFADADLVVLRSTWDYHDAPDAFARWLDDLARAHRSVLNPPSLARWNFEKGYLLDLAARGVPIPATRVIPAEPDALLRAIADLDRDRVVVKPAVGQSGHSVHLVPRDQAAAFAARDLATIATRRLLVQEFMAEVQRDGELSCVFFDGAFSHAAVKRPAGGDFRVNSQYQGTYDRAEPPAAVIDGAAAVLAALDLIPLYARVDGVVRDGAFTLMELELIEPGLFLQLDPAAPDRFAEATLRRLGEERPVV